MAPDIPSPDLRRALGHADQCRGSLPLIQPSSRNVLMLTLRAGRPGPAAARCARRAAPTGRSTAAEPGAWKTQNRPVSSVIRCAGDLQFGDAALGPSACAAALGCRQDCERRCRLRTFRVSLSGCISRCDCVCHAQLGWLCNVRDLIYQSHSWRDRPAAAISALLIAAAAGRAAAGILGRCAGCARPARRCRTRPPAARPAMPRRASGTRSPERSMAAARVSRSAR